MRVVAAIRWWLRRSSWRERALAGTCAIAVAAVAVAVAAAPDDAGVGRATGVPHANAPLDGALGDAERGAGGDDSATAAGEQRASDKKAARAKRKTTKTARRTAGKGRRRTASRRAGARTLGVGDGKAAPERGRPRRPAGSPAQAAEPVVVGIDVQDHTVANRFFATYSVDADAADPLAQARAVAAWINANGGVAGGRPLKLRPRVFSSYSRPTSVDDRATCSEWSSGDKPLVNIDRHASTDILIPCLARAGIATMTNGTTSPAVEDFARFPSLLYAPGSVAVDRAQGAYVRGLREAGFFQKGERVGLLVSSHLPQLEIAERALRSALRDAGVTLASEASVSLEDPASFFASEANAVLRFRRARIQRIVTLDDNGVTVGQFMRGAEAQGYRPLYGVNTISSPAWLAQNASARQLRGALGVGWSPLLDVSAADDPGGGDTRATCSSIFSQAGTAQGGRTPFGQYTAMQTCDSLLALRAALAGSGRATLDGLRSGIDGLGGSWRSGLSFSTSLSSQRHDGAAGWRLLRFRTECGCFRYEGPIEEM